MLVSGEGRLGLWVVGGSQVSFPLREPRFGGGERLKGRERTGVFSSSCKDTSSSGWGPHPSIDLGVPQIHMWKSYPQGDAVRGWGLRGDQVLRAEPLVMGSVPPSERPQGAPCLHGQRGRGDRWLPSVIQKRALKHVEPARTLILDFSLQSCEK